MQLPTTSSSRRCPSLVLVCVRAEASIYRINTFPREFYSQTSKLRIQVATVPAVPIRYGLDTVPVLVSIASRCFSVLEVGFSFSNGFDSLTSSRASDMSEKIQIGDWSFPVEMSTCRVTCVCPSVAAVSRFVSGFVPVFRL